MTDTVTFKKMIDTVQYMTQTRKRYVDMIA